MTESDVLIIGGGIAGVCTAFYLGQHGRRVTVLERGEIASEASGVNAGGLGGIGWGNSPDLRSYLTMGSLELFKDLQIGLGYDIKFRQSGGLQAIQSQAQYEFGCAKVLQLKSLGYDLELLSPRESRSIEPEASPDLLGFIHVPGRGQADPGKATRGFAAAAQSSGVEVLTNSPVTELTPLGDSSWSVLTLDDEFRAGTLVLAAGAWCGPLGSMLGLTIPIVPVRGQMWATGVLPPRLHHVMTAVESESSWYAESSGSGAHSAPPELTHRDGKRTTRHLYGRQTKTGEIVFGGDRKFLGLSKR
jgi:sarcosine oxidase subunit beta